MDFRQLTPEKQKEFSDLMFSHLSSPSEMKDWIKLFFDLDMPLDLSDPDSTASPIMGMWFVYEKFLNNMEARPGAILLSCREGAKTLGVSILELILLLHFHLDIGHGAATETQSSVALSYISGFLLKIEPLMKAAGWENISQNKRLLKFQTPMGIQPFLKVVIASAKGFNSLHCHCLFIDELDLISSDILKEAKNITGFSKGRHGMMVYLSTRKYAFGAMADAIDRADEMGYEVLRWNIIDMTEYCPPSRHLPDEPKLDRYVAINLPLKQIAPEEFEVLPPTEKPKWKLIKDVHAGCAKCPLLPVCKKRLSEKDPNSVGGLYKPIPVVIQKFKENDPDTAEAQLLCWRPGSEGLVFPRFSLKKDNGNVINLDQAYETLTGDPRKNVTELTLMQKLKDLQIPIFCGVDWGFTHDTVIVVLAKLPNDEIWVLDCFASPGLEFSDVLATAIGFRDRFNPDKWFCDQAMPSHIKSFNRNHMKSPSFTKDVIAGIEALRSKIVSANGKRLFKVLDTINNKKVINAITKHRFLLDGQGNSTSKPDDEPGIADICDALRYVGQNLFPVKGPQKPSAVWSGREAVAAIDRSTPEGERQYLEELEYAKKQAEYGSQLQQEITNRIGEGPITISTGKKGGFTFSF